MRSPTFHASASGPTEPGMAAIHGRRALVGWATDLLSLRRRGLLVPNWEKLDLACAAAGLARPPVMRSPGAQDTQLEQTGES